MARQDREILEQNTTAEKRDGWCLEVKRVAAKNHIMPTFNRRILLMFSQGYLRRLLLMDK